LVVRGQAEYLPANIFIYRHAPLSRSYCFHRLETYGKCCEVQASPHRLRHSCATLLLNAGAPAVSVQMILGHKRIDSTLGYARLYDGTIAADYYSAMN
jgi:site-specific recombinase XerD